MDNEINEDNGIELRPYEVDKLMRDIANRGDYIYFDRYGGGKTDHVSFQCNGQTINIRQINMGMIKTNGYRVYGTPYDADHKDFGNGEWRAVYKFGAPGGIGYEMWISISDDEAKKLPADHPLREELSK